MDDAVLDAIEPSAEVEETDVPAETGDTGEPAEGSAEGTQEAPAAETAPQALVVDGKKLSPEFEKTLAELKTANPALAKALRTAVFQQDRLQRELPGGFKELAQIKTAIETLGGEHGVQNLTKEVDGWREFDQQFTAGDPKALEFMVSSPAGQEAFLKLAPLAFEKYAELHPEAYQQYLCKLFVNDMVAERLPLDLERLQDFIGDDPRAKAVYDRICSYVNKIAGVAQKPVAPRQKATTDNRGSELETREKNLMREEWRRETASDQAPIFNSEWARLAGGRKIGAAQEGAIKELFESALGRSIKAHKEKLDRYFESGDREGFRRMAASISKTEIPKALRAAFDAVIPARPGHKPIQAGAKPAEKLPAPVPGFLAVSAMPARDSIDYTHPFNTPANFSAGKAILKDGKKVTWKR